MVQKQVFEYFKLYFPQFAENVECWFPNGKDSVRVRQTNKQEFVFTYHAKNDWRFETVEKFMKGLKGK